MCGIKHPHEWHSLPDNVDLVLLVYLTEQEQWKHEWGGVLQVGTKQLKLTKFQHTFYFTK